MDSENPERDSSSRTGEVGLLDGKFRLGDVSAFQRDLLAAAGKLEQAGETPTTNGLVEIRCPSAMSLGEIQCCEALRVV